MKLLAILLFLPVYLKTRLLDPTYNIDFCAIWVVAIVGYWGLIGGSVAHVII